MPKPKSKLKSKQRGLKALIARFEVVRVSQYLVSGGLYFWTGYAVFFVCDQFLGFNLWWAKLTANVVGWVVNYLLQRWWVFRDPALAKHRTEVTGRYIVITLVDFVLDYAIVRGLQMVGITPYIGQFASGGFFTVWNYLWYRSWVFTSRLHRKHGRKSGSRRG